MVIVLDINVNYHSSIKIGKIYIDPFKISECVYDAKYIFITHFHYDHYSLEDIKKVMNKDTIFVCTEDVEEDLSKHFFNTIIVVESGNNYYIGDLFVSTFPSYNISKKFHPKSNNWVGYVIETLGVKCAILGDSDLTEEVKNIKCDILFVPIGGTYTMDAKEASELTNIIKPSLVIPVHYNGVVGSKDDEKAFLEGLNKKIKYKLYV